MRKSILCLAAIILSISFITGCSKKEKSDKNVDLLNQTEAILDIDAQQEPEKLDSSMVQDEINAEIFGKLYENLLKVENGEIKPAGAKSWEQLEENSYQLILNENYWTDGIPVKAQDYVYSLQRKIQNWKEYDNIKEYYIIGNVKKIIKNTVDIKELGLSVIDDTTLEVTLSSGSLEDFAKLLLNPERKDIIEQYGEEYGTDINKMVFCGAYFIDKWEAGEYMLLRKNEVYWNANTIEEETVRYNFK